MAKRKPPPKPAKKATTSSKAKAKPRAKTKPVAKKKPAAKKRAAKKPAAKKKPVTKKPAMNVNLMRVRSSTKRASAESRVTATRSGRIDLGPGALALDRELGGVIADEVSAEAAIEAGDLDRAIAIYSQIIDSSSSPIASFLIARGRAFYRAGDHARAITDFERGLALEPHYPDLYFDKGKAELQAGLIADAEESFTHDIGLDPSPISFYNRHLARKALGNLGGALSDLDSAIEGMPDEAPLRVSRALMRHTADDHEGAFEDADVVATVEPDDLLHLDLCGRFALLAGRDARAAEAYGAANRLAERTGEPPNPQHLHGYALAIAGLGRSADALPFFDRAITLLPDDPSFLCNRAWTLHLQGRDADALVDLDRALTVDATYAQALRNRAAIYAAQGDRNCALADYRTLDELGHDVSAAIARLVAP